MQTAFVLNLKEGQTEKPLNVLGMPTYLKVSAKDTNGQFSLYYGEYKKKQGPPLHQHDLDEFFYVTEGEFLFQLGDKKVKAIAGSTIFIPRMMPDNFLVISELGKTLFMLSSPGKMEQLLQGSVIFIVSTINTLIASH